MGQTLTDLTFVIIFFLSILLFGSCNSDETKKSFYPNGKLKSVIELKNDVPHGLSIFYYQNGNLKEQATWLLGRKNGETKIYYEDGRLKEVHNYEKGKIHGKSVQYYSNGAIREERYFDHGKLFDVKSYLPSGNRDFENTFPVAYLSKDTIQLDEECSYFTKLVNADSNIYQLGILIITSKLDNEGNPVDTLFSSVSTNQKGFVYSFKGEAAGPSYILGQLIFRRKINNELVDEVYSFKKEFFVISDSREVQKSKFSI